MLTDWYVENILQYRVIPYTGFLGFGRFVLRARANTAYSVEQYVREADTQNRTSLLEGWILISLSL